MRTFHRPITTVEGCLCCLPSPRCSRKSGRKKKSSEGVSCACYTVARPKKGCLKNMYSKSDQQSHWLGTSQKKTLRSLRYFIFLVVEEPRQSEVLGAKSNPQPYRCLYIACSVKTRRAPSRRHCRGARVYGHTTTAMHAMT